MRRKLAAIVAGAMMVGNVSANDVKMTPMFDISYMHSDAQVDGNETEGLANPASHDDIDVQYAGIDFSGSSKNLDWQIGVNFAGDGNNTAFIDTASLNYGINDNFSFMAGRFYSFVGYEGTRSHGNWNYTKSIAKFVAPNHHEGVGASYDAKNGFAASLYYLDGIADSEESEAGAAGGSDGGQDEATSKRALGATVSYAMDKWKAEVDYYTTTDRSTLEDTTIYGANFSYNFNDQFSAAVAALMGSSNANEAAEEQSFDSYAAYLKFKATDKFYAALRYEMFSEEADEAGDFWYANADNFTSYAAAATDKDNDVDSITLTAGYDFMNGSELKLEYRADSSDKKIYTNPGQTEEEDSNNTIALCLVVFLLV